MNLIGYDAMAVGNHEFDNPLTVLRQQKSGRSFPFFPPIFIKKVPASVCLSRGLFLHARI